MPPTTTTDDPLEQATNDSRESMEAMVSEAEAFFVDKREREALNPLASALDRAADTPSKPTQGKQSAPSTTGGKTIAAAPAQGSSPQKSSSVAKVPGAPRLKAPAPPQATSGNGSEGEGVATVAAPPPAPANATPSAPDISDIPSEYVPGKIKAPHWEKLRANRNHFEALSVQRHQENEDLRAQLEQLKQASAKGESSGEVATRLQALQQERDTLQAKLEAVAVEKSPRFEAQFKPRRDAAIAQAKSAVGPQEAARIEALLAMPESSYRDEQVEALLSSLPPLRATKLMQSVADLDRLTSERQALAAQGNELYKAWTAEETSARERAMQERMLKSNAVFESELKEWADVGLTPDDVNAARSVYSGQGATLQDASRAALWAAVGPRIAQQANDAIARIGELEGELARLRSAQPNVGAGGGAPSSNGEDDDDPTTTDYATRIAREAARAGVRFGT